MEALLLWGFVLFGAALLVLALELFLPSGGLLALLCIGLVGGGVVCFFKASTTWGLISVGAVALLAPLVGYFMLKIYPDTAMGRRLILGDPEGRATRDAEPDSEPGADDGVNEAGTLVGLAGVALTELRPVGTVELDGKRIEASSEAGLIHAGQRVRVTAVEGAKVKVRPAP